MPEKTANLAVDSPVRTSGDTALSQAPGRAGQRLSHIADITRRTVGGVSLTHHALEMAEQVRHVFEVDACVIRLLEDQDLVLLASSGLPDPSRHPRLPMNWGISQQILDRRRAIFLPDIMVVPTVASIRNNMPNAYQFTSYAGAPMLAEDKVIGIIGLFMIEKRADFGQDDLDCLQILANNISVAIANEQLFEQIVTQRDQLQAAIDRQHRTDQLLRESEERLRLATQVARMFAFEWNPITDEVTRSADSTPILGVEHGSTVASGQKFLRSIHPEDQPRVQAIIKGLSPRQPTYTSSYRFIRADGVVVWLEESCRAFFDEEGKLCRLVGLTSDVTARKLAEEENHRLREELAHISRITTMGELAATIAHEVNQPLGAIISNAQASVRMMSSGSPDLAEIKAALSDIVHDGKRATAVIERVRTFLRRGSEVRPLDVEATIRDVLAFLGGRLEKQRVRVELDLAVKLPKVRADRTQVQQVLTNLMLNAMEAMERTPTDHRRIRINSRLADRDNIQVSIYDRGIGLPADRIEHLFDPFVTTKSRGMGMGLAISRSIVESHGGSLWAETERRDGATFHFTLPVYTGDKS